MANQDASLAAQASVTALKTASGGATSKLHWEAEVIVEHRSACFGCGSVHPLSRWPQVTSGLCPECGLPAGEPQIQRVAGVVMEIAQ